MTGISLAIPFPPSVNDAVVIGKNKRTGKAMAFSSSKKRRFVSDADMLYIQQKRSLGGRSIDGAFTYHLTLNEALRHGSADGDNRQKYALDYLQRVGIIKNDKYAEGGSWAWGPCEHEALISVWPFNPDTKHPIVHGEYCRVPTNSTEPSQCQKQG